VVVLPGSPKGIRIRVSTLRAVLGVRCVQTRRSQ
jgi:hypothetical protein